MKKYPRYRMDKKLEPRMAPQIGVMECSYKHLVKAFGNPTLSIDYGDDFDGVENCAWIIEFESGDTAKISDVRPFGNQDMDHKHINNWKVNAHSKKTYEWIKEVIRDSNPNG
jgi:hypothetical protein